MLQSIWLAILLAPPVPAPPPEGSEYDPAYRAKVTREGDVVSISPAPVYQLPKTYIDVDVRESGGAVTITAEPFDLSGGAKFVAAGEIVIRFVNPQ